MDIVARRPMVNEFNLNVMAEDSDMATSPSVSFPIRMENPAKQTYNVQQFEETGDFRSIAVGYRAEKEHVLVFKHPDDDPDVNPRVYGFLFASDYVTELRDEATAAGSTASATQLINFDTNAPGSFIPKGGTVPQTIFYGTSSPPSLAHLDQVAVTDFVGPVGDATIHIYTVKTTGRVSVTAKRADAIRSAALALGMETNLAFTATGVGTGTIEIGYHVWWDEDGVTVPATNPQGSPPTLATGTKNATWHTATRKLTVTVVAVD